jgi:transposase
MGLMKAVFIRELTDEEREALQAGLRSSKAFTVRRCQIVLASARGVGVSEIAQLVGCSRQGVHNVLEAFEQRSVASLQMRSRRPKSAAKLLDSRKSETLRALLHESPRSFGKPTSVWTLELAADVCFERGITQTRVSDETIRDAITRLGIGWKRAKNWITSPDPAYARKKNDATG